MHGCSKCKLALILRSYGPEVHPPLRYLAQAPGPRGLSIQPIQLPVEGFAFDSQDFGGTAFVPACRGQDPLDLLGLGVGQSLAGAFVGLRHRQGASDDRFVDPALGSEDRQPLDQMLELPHISWPGIGFHHP